MIPRSVGMAGDGRLGSCVMARSRQRRPGTIERAVIGSTRDASWLVDADAAAIWTLRDLAEVLDLLRRRQPSLPGMDQDPDLDDLRVRGETAGRLLRGCAELGLSPASRHRMGLDQAGPDVAAVVHAIFSDDPATASG